MICSWQHCNHSIPTVIKFGVREELKTIKIQGQSQKGTQFRGLKSSFKKKGITFGHLLQIKVRTFFLFFNTILQLKYARVV